MVDNSKENYGGDQIQILEGLEAVRKRPGMYIGSTSSRGLHHLVYEIVDNSVDEALAGFCNTIDVQINSDNSITVKDNGRGIPVQINTKTGRPAVEVVFTVLHAGGKFGGGAYKVSGGLHGVGASVVNALSTWLEVKVYNGGNIYFQRYERGKIMNDLKVIGQCDPEFTGTEVTFLPDPEIFEDTVYDYNILKTFLKDEFFKGMKVYYQDIPERESSGMLANLKSKLVINEPGDGIVSTDRLVDDGPDFDIKNLTTDQYIIIAGVVIFIISIIECCRRCANGNHGHRANQP